MTLADPRARTILALKNFVHVIVLVVESKGPKGLCYSLPEFSDRRTLQENRGCEEKAMIEAKENVCMQASHDRFRSLFRQNGRGRFRET